MPRIYQGPLRRGERSAYVRPSGRKYRTKKRINNAVKTLQRAFRRKRRSRYTPISEKIYYPKARSFYKKSDVEKLIIAGQSYMEDGTNSAIDPSVSPYVYQSSQDACGLMILQTGQTLSPALTQLNTDWTTAGTNPPCYALGGYNVNAGTGNVSITGKYASITSSCLRLFISANDLNNATDNNVQHARYPLECHV